MFQNCLGLAVGGFAMYIETYFNMYKKQCSSFNANLSLLFSSSFSQSKEHITVCAGSHG